METGRCRACPAPILWAKTYKTGTAIPVDPDPDAQGNLLLLPESMQTVNLTAAEARWLRGLGVALYISHFATCPAADERRRQRRGADRRG